MEKKLTRAKERALEAYPDYQTMDGGYVTQRSKRKVFIQGYEQAEKDLALTIEDLELIHTFLYAVKNNKHGTFTFTRLSDEQYQEVLNRFNKSKEEK